MAIKRNQPVCPKCGESIKAKHRYESDMPKSMRIIGDTFICWDWAGHKCKQNDQLTTFRKLPNNIELLKLAELLKYSDRYEISIQFWPKQIAVFIAKDGIDLNDYGGDFDFVIKKAIEYLKRINRTKTIV